MTDVVSHGSLLDVDNPAAWPEVPFEELLTLPRTKIDEAQRQALIRRFETMRNGISALNALATRQGVDRIETIEDAAPAFFDHRVYKSYPLSLIERREFARLTAWMNRLTVQDVTAIPLNDVTSVDAWLNRLDEHGMIMLHSTGTTGKLSFIPRSMSEWPAWQNSFFEVTRASTGVDRRKVTIPSFYPGYRDGHTGGTKMQRLFSEAAEGDEHRHVLYDYTISSDLLSMAGRLKSAEEAGELDRLEIDPWLLEQRARLIEEGRRREGDLRRWFTQLAEQHRGQRVRIVGVTGELVRLAMKGREEGVDCSFAPDSILFTSGGLKGLENAPDNWEQFILDFYGVRKMSSIYGMSECMGSAPSCEFGYFHFMPYTVPLLLDGDGNVLPRQGVHTGRLALFDLLAETYWGGFVTGDRVTLHWDENCECGWKTPRIERDIVRFSQLDGGDDKISCAGTEEAYNEFMDYVSRI